MKYQELEAKINPLYQRRLSVGVQSEISKFIQGKQKELLHDQIILERENYRIASIKHIQLQNIINKDAASSLESNKNNVSKLDSSPSHPVSHDNSTDIQHSQKVKIISEKLSDTSKKTNNTKTKKVSKLDKKDEKEKEK